MTQSATRASPRTSLAMARAVGTLVVYSGFGGADLDAIADALADARTRTLGDNLRTDVIQKRPMAGAPSPDLVFTVLRHDSNVRHPL